MQKNWNRNTKSKTESTVTGTKSLTRNWKRLNWLRAKRMGNHSHQQNRKKIQTEKQFQGNSAKESNCKETELVRIWSYVNGGKPWTLWNDNQSNLSNDTYNGQTKQVFLQNFYWQMIWKLWTKVNRFYYPLTDEKKRNTCIEPKGRKFKRETDWTKNPGKTEPD